MATLLGIAIKPHGASEMRELDSATISCERGVEGDSRGKPGPRQVTVIALADWQAACEELAIERHWSDRRANLLVDALSFVGSKGQQIQIGDVLLEITGETDPCHRMESLHAGLFNALAKEWRGGVTCRVLQGGEVVPGQSAELL